MPFAFTRFLLSAPTCSTQRAREQVRAWHAGCDYCFLVLLLLRLYYVYVYEYEYEYEYADDYD